MECELGETTSYFRLATAMERSFPVERESWQIKTHLNYVNMVGELEEKVQKVNLLCYLLHTLVYVIIPQVVFVGWPGEKNVQIIYIL